MEKFGSVSSQLTADVVVIGGGATGLGIARDASLRGFKVILIEKGEIGNGASGRFHGLLHSGARYVVDDPATAIECFQENQILQEIAPSAIRDTGGLFLALSDQEAEYGDKLVAACQRTEIPIDELSLAAALRQEPFIVTAPKLKRVLSVPDGFVDGAELLRLNRIAAEIADVPVKFLTHHAVSGFRKSGDQLNAVVVQDLRSREEKIIECGFIINTSGVWSGRVSALAGVSIDLELDKGTMIVLDKQLSTAVLNRCRPQANGDILVPTGESSIMGTTSHIATDLDNPEATQQEIEFLLQACDEMAPGISNAKVKVAYAGIRPLVSKTSEPNANSRGMSRSFQVIDHKQDGINNFISVVGGKVTIYRRMAEAAVDLMCEKQRLLRRCRTAEIALQPTQPAGAVSYN